MKKATFKPKLHKCEYVRASDVFEGLQGAYDALTCGPSLPFTWGDNNHSLVDADTIATEMEQLDESEGGQIAKAIKRLRALGQTYVDMES